MIWNKTKENIVPKDTLTTLLSATYSKKRTNLTR
jgi:hypothetical protein